MSSTVPGRGDRAAVFIYHRTSKSAEGRQQLTAGKAIVPSTASYRRQTQTDRFATFYATPGKAISRSPRNRIEYNKMHRQKADCTGSAALRRARAPRKIVGNQRNTRIDFTPFRCNLIPESLLQRVTRFNKPVGYRVSRVSRFLASSLVTARVAIRKGLLIFSHRRGQPAILIDTSPFIPLSPPLILHSHMSQIDRPSRIPLQY